MNEEKMKVVMVEPNKPAYITEIGSDLTSMQNALMVGNEEAKLIGLDGNRRFGNNIVAGPFFICGEKMTEDGEEFCSLSDDLCEKYVHHFAEPLEISHDEVQRDMGFTLIMM